MENLIFNNIIGEKYRFAMIKNKKVILFNNSIVTGDMYLDTYLENIEIDVKNNFLIIKGNLYQFHYATTALNVEDVTKDNPNCKIRKRDIHHSKGQIFPKWLSFFNVPPYDYVYHYYALIENKKSTFILKDYEIIIKD